MNSIDSWQGEYVIGIEAAPQDEKMSQMDETTLKWVTLLENQMGHKDLSEIVSEMTGLPKKDAYKELLARKK
jgi:16S rRNA (cytidine1402-2'-O)-methyltransferase